MFIGRMFESFYWMTLDSSKATTDRKAYLEPRGRNKPPSWASILEPAPPFLSHRFQAL